MHDAARVGGRERLGERQGQLEQRDQREAAARRERLQRLALDQLHGQEAHAGALLDRVQDDDVRVAERGDRARLALEKRKAFGVVGDRLGQGLDGHVPAQLRVARTPDLSHAARAQRGEHLVVGEPLSGLERHGRDLRGAG